MPFQFQDIFYNMHLLIEMDAATPGELARALDLHLASEEQRLRSERHIVWQRL